MFFLLLFCCGHCSMIFSSRQEVIFPYVVLMTVRMLDTMDSLKIFGFSECRTFNALTRFSHSENVFI